MGVERATLKHLHLPQRWPVVTVVLLRIIVGIDQEGLICLVVLLRERQGRINWAMLHASLLLAVQLSLVRLICNRPPKEHQTRSAPVDGDRCTPPCMLKATAELATGGDTTQTFLSSLSQPFILT